MKPWGNHNILCVLNLSLSWSVQYPSFCAHLTPLFLDARNLWSPSLYMTVNWWVSFHGRLCIIRTHHVGRVMPAKPLHMQSETHRSCVMGQLAHLLWLERVWCTYDFFSSPLFDILKPIVAQETTVVKLVFEPKSTGAPKCTPFL